MAGLVKSNQAVKCVFTTANPTTGAAVNADSLPTGLLYVNGVVNAAVVTIANVTTGVYTASLTLPTLAGGDGVDIRISATVSTIAGEAVVWSSSADTKRISDLNDSAYAGGAVASVIGNVGGNVTGSVGSVTAPVTAGTVSDKTGYSLATAPPTAAQIDTQLTGTHGAGTWQQGNTVAPDNASVAAIKAKTDTLPADPASNTQVNTRMATFVYTAPDNADIALIKAKTDNLPSDPASNTEVDTRLATSNFIPPANGSIAAIKAKTDNLPLDPASNTEVDTRLATSGYTAPANSDVTLIKAKTDNLPSDPASAAQVNTRLATSGYTVPPTTAAIVAAILDGLLTGHTLPDSVAAALLSAAASADLWAVDLPGAYVNPQAGYIVGTRLDTTVGSRAIAGTVTQTAPYGAAGLMRLHVGADYGPSPGNLPRVLWTVGAGAAPDATGGSFAVSIPGLIGSPFAGSIIIASDNDVQLFEALFTHSQTAGWITGTHHFRAWLTTAGGAQVLIAEGLIEVGPGA